MYIKCLVWVAWHGSGDGKIEKDSKNLKGKF